VTESIPAESFGRKGWILILLISTAGLCLRFLELNHYGLWLDEALSVRFSRESIQNILAVRRHNNPPLYFLMLHGWMSIFSRTETSIRMISILFGTLAIPAIAVLGKYFWNRTTGFIAAFLMAAMVFPIHFSQIARNYSLLLFLSTACFFFFIRSLEAPSKSSWSGYVLFAVALLFTHSYSVFLLIVQNLYVLFFYRKKEIFLRWIGIQLLVLLCTTPWFIQLFQKSTRLLQEGFWIPEPTVGGLIQIVRSYFAFLVFPQILLVFLFFIVYALVDPFLNTDSMSIDRDKRLNILLILWGFGAILAPFLLSLILTPFFVFRYTIGSLPAFYLLFARGFSRFPIRSLKVTVSILILFTTVLSLQQYYSYSPDEKGSWKRSYVGLSRERWRELIFAMKRQTRRNDLITVVWGRTSLFRYYAPKLPFVTVPVLDTGDTREERLQQIRKLVAGKKRLWVLVGDRPTPEQILLITTLRKHYQEMKPRPNSPDSSVFLFAVGERSS
jgi:uncharacterized membrane protein